MSIQLLKAQDQNTGAFDNGKIKERKPVAFPGENPALQPFSTLFYWAYAWSNHGGLIGEQEQRLAINASTDAVLFAIEAPDPAPYQTSAAARQ